MIHTLELKMWHPAVFDHHHTIDVRPWSQFRDVSDTCLLVDDEMKDENLMLVGLAIGQCDQNND